ncbi:MAG: DMT family transporter [Kiritimatiellae bacterium]|nr:DMT family transporter [Kiritimatiellia bacterium]
MTVYRLFALIFGVYCCSTAVIFIKMSETHPVVVAAGRLLLAAALLAPVWLRSLRAHGQTWRTVQLGRTIWPGILLGIHFMTWIVGARMTGAANASLIVNMVPLAMPFLARDGITRREILGTVVGMTGIIFLGTADFHIGWDTFLGDMICFVSMLFFASYLAISRRSRDVADIWIFIVPVYAVAGLFCLVVTPFFVNPIQPYATRELLLIAGLAVVPTILGHSSLLYCMKHLRSQAVAIGTLGQFIFAGIMAFFMLNEVPGWPFYLASVLLLTGAIIAIRSTAKAE